MLGDRVPNPGRNYKRKATFRKLSPILGFLGLLLTACLYDADHRCDAHQHEGVGESCVCDEGFVFRGQTCVPCGEHEVYEAGVCACEDGFARSGDSTSACIERGAGTECDPGEACADPAFPVCRDHGGGAGYCTKECEADDECPHGYACDAEQATCMMAPVGQGDACTSNDDCAGKDATYCETTVAGACLVQDCSMDNPLSCSEGFGCCDLNDLGLPLTLCVPEDSCPTAK